MRARAVAAVAVLLAGCGRDAAPDATAGPSAAALPGAPASGAVDPRLLEPLEGLGPCQDLDPQPAVTPDGPVPGLVLPGDAVVTVVTATGPLVQVQGLVTRTPIQLRVWYQEESGLEVITVEDEVWESEALVSDGEWRLYVKAQALCATESAFVAFVGPEEAASALPVPSGAATNPVPPTVPDG